MARGAHRQWRPAGGPEVAPPHARVARPDVHEAGPGPLDPARPGAARRTRRELSKLQDAAPPVAWSDIDAAVTGALGGRSGRALRRVLPRADGRRIDRPGACGPARRRHRGRREGPAPRGRGRRSRWISLLMRRAARVAALVPAARRFDPVGLAAEFASNDHRRARLPTRRAQRRTPRGAVRGRRAGRRSPRSSGIAPPTASSPRRASRASRSTTPPRSGRPDSTGRSLPATSPTRT